EMSLGTFPRQNEVGRPTASDRRPARNPWRFVMSVYANQESLSLENWWQQTGAFAPVASEEDWADYRSFREAEDAGEPCGQAFPDEPPEPEGLVRVPAPIRRPRPRK